MVFLGLTNTERDKLEFEVVSERVRLKLTRLLRAVTDRDDSVAHMVMMNRAINIARSVLGLWIYQLEAEDGEYYYPAEYGWHYSEIELALRRPNVIELVETLADLIQSGILDIEEVNEILQSENLSFSFNIPWGSSEGEVQVEILSLEEIEESDEGIEHPNIRILVKRMDTSLENEDWSGVLHASASIFETLAKDVIELDTIQNQSLGSFFDRYRSDSGLPAPVLDYIQNIYRQRNVEPLAGHGSIQQPTIGRNDAIIMAEMTKAFVKIERKLLMSGISLDDRIKRDGAQRE